MVFVVRGCENHVGADGGKCWMNMDGRNGYGSIY